MLKKIGNGQKTLDATNAIQLVHTSHPLCTGCSGQQTSARKPSYDDKTLAFSLG